MGLATTKAKQKYNQGAYKRYEFNVGIDSRLNAAIQQFKDEGNNLSEIIRAGLCEHFGLTTEQGESFYQTHHLGTDGALIPNEISPALKGVKNV